MTTLLDTGVILAAAHVDDEDHHSCIQFLADPPPGPLLLPSPVLIEACWLINSRMGAAAHRSFLTNINSDLAAGYLTLADVIRADIERMADLSSQYHDARLDPTDLSIIALAERHNINRSRPTYE